jgi:osmotically-inducible protein OsmY
MLHRSEQTATQGDSYIHQGILDYLSGLQMLALRQIRVAVHNGTVILRGEVHSFYQKQLLLNCRSHVPGVDRVIDEVRVIDSPQAVPA